MPPAGSASRRILVRDMLLDTVVHLYALFSQPHTLPRLVKHLNVVELLRLVGPGRD